MTTEERIFRRGETVPVYDYVYDWDGNLVDPDQGVTINIKNPSGTLVATAQAMSKLATGKYVYYYASQASDEEGWYIPECTAQDGVGGGAKICMEASSFKLQ